MEFEAFDAEAAAQWERIPAVFKEGVTALFVEESAGWDPALDDVPLLGECIVDATIADIPDAPMRSRIHLYYGSFALVALREPGFSWSEEIWETLTHELRHHLEWCAGYDQLGHEDDLQHENLARLQGKPFDPDFYRGGARLDDGVYAADGDLFLELRLRRPEWSSIGDTRLQLEWSGIECLAPPPTTQQLQRSVVFLQPEVVVPNDLDLPWHDVVVVLRKRGLFFGFG